MFGVCCIFFNSRRKERLRSLFPGLDSTQCAVFGAGTDAIAALFVIRGEGI